MAKTGKALKRTQAKSKEKMNRLTTLFTVGVLIETYLLVVNQLYTQGTGAQMMTMSAVLTGAGLAGAALAAVGIALLYRGQGKARLYAPYLVGVGAFLAMTSTLCLKVNTSAAGMLGVAVPVALLLAVVYSLYVSDFFWLAMSLTVSLGAVWYWRHCAAVRYLRASAIVLLVLALAVVIAIMVLTLRSAKSRGVVTLGERRIRMLEKDSKPALLALHGGCVAVMLISAVSSALALYGFLLLAVVLFGAAVYYTVAAL